MLILLTSGIEHQHSFCLFLVDFNSTPPLGVILQYFLKLLRARVVLLFPFLRSFL